MQKLSKIEASKQASCYDTKVTLSRRQFYTFLFFAIPLIYFISIPVRTSDLAIWIAIGRASIARGSWLHHDSLSFLPTAELVYPAGICFIYGLFYQLGGLLLVSFAHKLALGGVLGMIYFSSLARLKEPWSKLNLALVFLVWCETVSFVVDRPAMIAMVPFLASFLVLQKEEELSLGDLLRLVLINMIWVNIHGSWLMLSGMFFWRVAIHGWIRRFSWREALSCALILASSLCNPFGYHVFDYVLQTAMISRQRGLTEWSITGFRVYFPQGILFYLLFLTVIVVVLRDGKLRAKTAGPRMLASPLVPLFFLGALSLRNTVWPFLALLPVAHHFGFLHEETSEDRNEKTIFNGAIALCVMWVGVIFLPMVRPVFSHLLPPEKQTTYDITAPWKAVDFLRKAPEGRIFSDWDLAGFLALEQKNPTFVDTLNIIFSDAQFSDYRKIITAAPGWDESLKSYQVQYLVLMKEKNAPLVEAVSRSHAWEQVVDDPGVISFRRL